MPITYYTEDEVTEQVRLARIEGERIRSEELNRIIRNWIVANMEDKTPNKWQEFCHEFCVNARLEAAKEASRVLDGDSYVAGYKKGYIDGEQNS